MTDSVNWPALYEIGLLNIYDFIGQDKPFQKWKHYPRRVCGQVLREIIVTLQSGGGNPLVVLLAALVDFLFHRS